jgi:hypothetical protein
VELEENDPDTLQLKDESNADWVKLWHKTAKKKNFLQNDLTIEVILPKKETQQNSKFKSKRTL